MNLFKLTAACGVALCMLQPAAFAQTKNELKKQVTDLEAQAATLRNDVITLENENDKLSSENRNYLERMNILNSQVTQMQRDYDALNQNYKLLESENQQLKASSGASTWGGTSGSSGSGSWGSPGTSTGSTQPPATGSSGYLPYPQDNRKCAYYQDKLEPNQTYTELYNKLESSGWGIQVFASSNLCQAAEKAEAFKQEHKLYKTYLRCKSVGGRTFYAVVYGSLKDEAQAKTYLTNFKKIAKAPWGTGPFLVQH